MSSLLRRALIREYKLFLLLSMVVVAQSASAQSGIGSRSGSLIQGVVADGITKRPIQFGTLLLRNRKNQKVGVITNDKGYFRLNDIQPGVYSLQVSFLGYQTKSINDLVVIDAKPLHLDTIFLYIDNKILEKVTVTGRLNLVEEKGDKIVYHAENDIANTGGSAIDVLRRTPMVSVDASGDVHMLGSGSIQVMMNGKVVNSSTKSVGNALKTISANNIKSVEVITNSSAKYDSEGTGGVINIVTRKHLKGADGNVSLTGGNRTQSVSAEYGMQNQKVSVTINANYGRFLDKGNSSFERTNRSRTNSGSLTQHNNFRNNNLGGDADLGITYNLDSLNLFSFSLTNWGSRDPNVTSMYSQHDFANQPDREYRQDVDYTNPYGNTSTDFSYTRRFKRPQQELEIISQYSSTYDDYRYTVNRYDPSNALLYRGLSENKSNSSEWTVQADYSHPFDIAQRKVLELGAKVILRDMMSDYRIEDSASGTTEVLEINPSLSNVFDYAQKVVAGYTSFRISTKSRWTLLMGARVEHTWVEGNFKSSSAEINNHYFNFIPNVTVSAKIKEGHSLKASFTQRISRPQVWHLNPYINETDANNLQTGNPELRPELSNLGQLGYSLTTKRGLSIITNLYWRQANNAVQSVITVQDDGDALIRPENVGLHRRFGMSVYVSADITSRWNISANTESYHAYLQSPEMDITNSGWIFRGNMNTSFKFPEKYTFLISSSYSSRLISLTRRTKDTYSYSIAAKKDFLNEKASLTLNIDNPFNAYTTQESIEEAAGFTTFRINNAMNRSFRLSLNWKFGSGSRKESTVKKVINDDNSPR